MPRPRKFRRVCSRPKFISFNSQDGCDKTITMGIDEYETIRLIDFQGLNQEQCAEQMDIARTTVQAIYASARKKLAGSIVRGHRLVIIGGDVVFCENRTQVCGHGCCRFRANPSCK